MKPVVEFFSSYPIFLWITWCKILFIVSDQFGKSFFHLNIYPMWKTKKQYKTYRYWTYFYDALSLPGYLHRLFIF